MDCATSWAKVLQLVVLPDLQREGLERKEAFLLKAFLVTFVATKVTRPRGYERNETSIEPERIFHYVDKYLLLNNLLLYQNSFKLFY